MEKLPAGRYYIGDLCYVLNEEWDEVCNIIFSGNHDEGIFELSDGRKFAIFNTMYGDGVYADNFGHSYPVDSGSIGCIKADYIKNGERSGEFFNFEDSFEVSRDNYGCISFGNIVSINTGDEEEYIEEYEDE